MRPDIKACWAEAPRQLPRIPRSLKAKAVETPTLDDDIMRLAGEHFPYMRGDDYGSGFIPVDMSSHTLGRDLLNFAHAVRALPVPPQEEAR
jgi:hypothetical protein